MPQRSSSGMDRRSFLGLTGASVGSAFLCDHASSLARIVDGERRAASNAQCVFRIEPDAQRARIPFISWDTEGGSRAKTNLLRLNSAVVLRIRNDGMWRDSSAIEARRADRAAGVALYELTVASAAELHWTIHTASDRIVMTVSGHGPGIQDIEAVEMLFPFDPKTTPTTILPRNWSANGRGELPAVISSPDFGQILLNGSDAGVKARLEGNRDEHTVDFVLEFPDVVAEDEFTLTFTPVVLAPPIGMSDTNTWKMIRRGWFNIWQPSSRWGDQNRSFSAPAGILANNVISDPVSFALPFYADQALWTSEVAPGISVMEHVRQSIDWWLEHRTDPSGEVVGYWNYRHFLDANPGILISSWDYVEATGDHAWLAEAIERLELLSKFLEQRDVDGDGMVEATQSGNSNTLIEPTRSCCWWDALNCGHKDGYTNAMIYRAWRCLAELEGQLHRQKQQEHVTKLADRLKAAYAKTLYNPATGWLAWWKSADGELHDYATPIVNGMAIEYGLMDPAEGRRILSLLLGKMRDVNFARFDLGLPCTLVPVLRADYLQPNGLGVPRREDGTDTFQDYMNGGISAGHTLHFIIACHIVGESEKGDEILHAMLQRHATVGFQNGVQNEANKGIDWTNWTGEPRGYEGYLADVFMFMQAAVLREPSLRARFCRPFLA
jgi:hypothetical protein